jgi:predicted nucleotidyltransferase
MQTGLSQECVVKIIAVFKKYDEIQEAILYGSRAKGNFKPGSDIDLTVKGKGLNLTILNKIVLDLDDLMLPYTFDLSIFSQIQQPDMIDHIGRVGKIFYSKSAGGVA